MSAERGRFVVTPDVVLALAARSSELADGVQLVAPTLLRSQVLSMLYGSVHTGEMTEPEARRRLDYVRGLRTRLLGDRVLQDVAWRISAELDLATTLDAEYIALTRLQADALVTGDTRLRELAARVVPVATIDTLIAD